MKTLIFIFSLWLICPPQTDTYYIIKVSGDMINSTTGASISQGDEIQSVDEIQFGDKDVYALVMSDKGDRLKVQFLGTGPDESGLYKGFVKNSLSKSNKKKIKTRSFITNADIKNLKEFLGDDQFTVIGNNLDVQLSKEVFVDNSVLAQYEKNGQKIDKELIDQDYKLNLSRTNLGAKPSGETKIYHVDFFQKSDQIGTQKITRLDFNFIDAPALKDEMSTIIGVYTKKGLDKTAMKNYLMEYFVDFYGNTHLYTLSEFVDKIIAEKMK